MDEVIKTPHLAQLTPYHVSDSAGQEPVHTQRFHGSQRLNLMRPTRLPANSRKYSRGDPVHLIDWRAFARNEQLVIREHLDEASCKIQIIIEAGPGSDWPDANLARVVRQNLCTKRELSWRIGLHLAYQYLKAGDAVRLYQQSEQNLKQLSLRSNTEVAIHFEQMVLGDFQSNLILPLETKAAPLLAAERCDLLFWISDGFLGIPPWLLAKKGTVAIWIHTLSALEVDLSWLHKEDAYFDEQALKREYLGEALLERSALQNGIKDWREGLARQWAKVHRHYSLVHDDYPIQKYLFQLEQSWQAQPKVPFARKS